MQALSGAGDLVILPRRAEMQPANGIERMVAAIMVRRALISTKRRVPSDERVDDSEAAKLTTVLHVFRKQCVAASLQRCRDDQRVIEGDVVVPCERDGAGMGVFGQRNDVWKPLTNHENRSFDVRPRALALVPRDIGKFVQHLRADASALGKRIERLVSFVDVQKSVDEDVRVEKRLHRSFASSRSNL